MLEFASELQPTKRILEIKCWSSQANSKCLFSFQIDFAKAMNDNDHFFCGNAPVHKLILEIKCWSSQAHSNLRNEIKHYPK